MTSFRSPVVRALAALILVLVLGVIFHAEGTFLKWSTHRDTLRQVSVYGMLACGMTLVIITGGIDLAVGSILGLASITFAYLSIRWGWSAWAAIPACIAIGGACGLASGGVIVRFRVQPFIATLALMVFARGLAKCVSAGKKVSASVEFPGAIPPIQVHPVFEFLNSRILGGNLAVVTLILLVCVLGCWVLLDRLRWGRYLFAVGGNEEAARLSGVPTGAAKILAYGLSGVTAAVAGICQAAQELQGDPEAGATYELTAIAIVVIGGTSLMGGRGGIGLTLLGALIIGYLEKVLSINAVPESSRLMLTGVIIIGAVLFQKSRA